MTQEEYFGLGSLRHLPEVLKRAGVSKIFLLTGKSSYKISGAEALVGEALQGYEVTVFRDFTENPKLEDVEKGMRALKESGSEVVLAVGGGNVIDVAKSINILAAQPGDPEAIVKGEQAIVNKGVPMIAVPTTAGAGSEATHFAVVYLDKNKYSIAHPHVLPDVAIVDPRLTFNLNPGVTATSGIDVLCQSVESHWNVHATEVSRAYSAEAIGLVLAHLETAVNRPTEGSRVGMAKAANLAGKAINITKTTAPHALSYTLTSYFGVPHGQAVSVTLGAFLEYNHAVTEVDALGAGGARAAKASVDAVIALLGCAGPKQAREKIAALMTSIGLKTRLSELGAKTDADLDLMMDNVNLERLKNNPRVVTREGLRTLLRSLL